MNKMEKGANKFDQRVLRRLSVKLTGPINFKNGRKRFSVLIAIFLFFLSSDIVFPHRRRGGRG